MDLSKATVDEQQRANYTRAAEITALIRDLEPAGVSISIGGEIGEVGKQNSNEQELRAYLDGFRAVFDAKGGAGECYRNAFNRDLGKGTVVLSVSKTF